MSSKREISYLLSGPGHLPYLITSLYTLRRHYSERVAIYAWQESYELACRIGEALRAEVYLSEPPYRKNKANPTGSNSQFYHKINLMQTIRADTALYLDADTLIVGDVTPLFEAAEKFGFAATQFSDWTTAGGVIHNRLSRLIDRDGIEQEWVEYTMRNVIPSVNGGVFACKPTSPVLVNWQQQTEHALGIFIADECVLHAMSAKYAARDELVVLPGRKFNLSPRYRPRALDESAVVIYHGHGDCWTRPDKSALGFGMWKAVLDVCRKQNIAGINEWLPSIQHRYLNRLQKTGEL